MRPYETREGVFDAERFCHRFLGQGHNGHIGLSYVASGADWIELAMANAPEIRDATGSISDGALVTLVDMTATVAVWVLMRRWVAHATIDLRLDRPSTGPGSGALIGHAHCRAVEGDIAFVQGYARTDAGGDFANFAATYKLLTA